MTTKKPVPGRILLTARDQKVINVGMSKFFNTLLVTFDKDDMSSYLLRLFAHSLDPPPPISISGITHYI
jgi:hypothetical protein